MRLIIAAVTESHYKIPLFAKHDKSGGGDNFFFFFNVQKNLATLLDPARKKRRRRKKKGRRTHAARLQFSTLRRISLIGAINLSPGLRKKKVARVSLLLYISPFSILVRDFLRRGKKKKNRKVIKKNKDSLRNKSP